MGARVILAKQSHPDLLGKKTMTIAREGRACGGISAESQWSGNMGNPENRDGQLRTFWPNEARC
jgi:hypothetical protein